MAAAPWLPRIRPEHGLCRTRNGGTVYGVAAEVEDPHGAVWALLSAADGTRSIDELVAYVVAAHNDENAVTVAGAVHRFIDAGRHTSC